MPRLRNVRSGAVVSVTAEKAARLGSEWEPVVVSTPEPKKPAPRRRPKFN